MPPNIANEVIAVKGIMRNICLFHRGDQLGDTKRDQITFRLEPEAFRDTKDGADIEDLKLADFSRKLHRSALMLYEHFGSLAELKKHVDKVASEKRTKKGGAA